MVNNVDPRGRISLSFDNMQTKLSPKDQTFSDRLKSAIKDVNNRQNIADDSIEQVIEGKLGIHEGMLSIQEADTTFRLLVQTRNKVMDAYKEVMRMTV